MGQNLSKTFFYVSKMFVCQADLTKTQLIRCPSGFKGTIPKDFIEIREVIYPRVLHECSIRIQKSYPKHEIPKPNTWFRIFRYFSIFVSENRIGSVIRVVYPSCFSDTKMMTPWWLQDCYIRIVSETIFGFSAKKEERGIQEGESMTHNCQKRKQAKWLITTRMTHNCGKM